jgi:aquaporin Z
MRKALQEHWPEYLMEAWGLGMFMVSAGLFATLLEYPAWPLRQTIENPFTRRFFMGIAMGITAVGIIYSPWGKRSGAHINPAVTLTFYRLKKIAFWDAFFYIVAQFIGGYLGIVLISIFLGEAIASPAIKYVVTLPGSMGISVAFAAEAFLSFSLMLVILFATNRQNLNSYTGLFAGGMVALFIILEAPLSGMSINPARSFGSALPAHIWTAFWIYMTAPPLGMLAAGEIYLRKEGLQKIYCAKLHHNNNHRCIFKCRYHEISGTNQSTSLTK